MMLGGVILAGARALREGKTLRERNLALLASALIALGIIGIVAVAVLTATQLGITEVPPPPVATPTTPGVSTPQPAAPAGTPISADVANGHRIYFTDTDRSGQPIPYQGGIMMMRVTCANCHGADGHGRSTMMFVSPNITYANLTNPEGMLEPDGQRIPPYNDSTLRSAITQGIDSEGKPLELTMPRWQMSEKDINDLIAFLKALK